MTEPHVISYEALLARVQTIFERAGVRPESAQAVARVIVAGERDNCKSHGIYRVEGCLLGNGGGKTAAPPLIILAL